MSMKKKDLLALNLRSFNAEDGKIHYVKDGVEQTTDQFGSMDWDATNRELKLNGEVILSERPLTSGKILVSSDYYKAGVALGNNFQQEYTPKPGSTTGEFYLSHQTVTKDISPADRQWTEMDFDQDGTMTLSEEFFKRGSDIIKRVRNDYTAKNIEVSLPQEKIEIKSKDGVIQSIQKGGADMTLTDLETKTIADPTSTKTPPEALDFQAHGMDYEGYMYTLAENEIRGNLPGDPKNWAEEKDCLKYSTAGMAETSKKLLKEILASYGVTYQETAGEISVQKTNKALETLDDYWKDTELQQKYHLDHLTTAKAPKLVAWTSPAISTNWGVVEDKKEGTLMGHVTTYCIKPKNDEEKAAILEYLQTNVGIKPDKIAEGPAGEMTENAVPPIKAGENVLQISDKDSLEKLQELFKDVELAPELENPPKGLLSDAPLRGKVEEYTVPPKRSPIPPTPHTPDVPHAPAGTGLDLSGLWKGVAQQGKNIGDSYFKAWGTFNDKIFGKSFDSPEAMGEEFLYQIMAFPLEWLANYLDTLGKSGEAKPSEKNKELLDKIKDLQKKAGLSDPMAPMMPNGYTPEKHQQRVDQLRAFLNNPANAALKQEAMQNSGEYYLKTFDTDAKKTIKLSEGKNGQLKVEDKDHVLGTQKLTKSARKDLRVILSSLSQAGSLVQARRMLKSEKTA